jgi:hypothetical protein
MKAWHLSYFVGAFVVFAAIFQIADTRPSAATAPTAAEATFSVARHNFTIVAKSSMMSPNDLVESAFDAAAGKILARFEAPSGLSHGRLLPDGADEADTAPPNVEETSQQEEDDSLLPADSSNPAARELPYLKYYVYSELPPPEKLTEIALEALRNVPLGTPIEEIKRAAAAFGLDFNFMKAVAKIESDFNPKERTGSYIGLFQLSRAEFHEYGSGDIYNPRDNAMAAAYKFVTEAALFEVLTDKKPTFSDLYLIHQQGWEGAAQHVSHPDRIAWKSMCATDEGKEKGERWCKRAIWWNTLPAVKREWKSVDRLTSGAFVAMWRDRMNTLYARYADADTKQAQVQQ